MTIKNETIKLIKEQYSYLKTEYGVEKIGLFGSIAKGIERKDSDIDIVVELKRPIGLKFIELVEYLESLFNRKVDVLTPEGIGNIRIRKIAEDIKRSIFYV